METKVLVVDDEKAIVDILKYNLQKEGLVVDTAKDGVEALSKISESHYAVVLLDIMMPKMDGIEVCKRLRSVGNNVPIIMLTARAEEVDKVLGLEVGADDYITKPFSIKELVARVKASIRRMNMDTTPASDGNLLTYQNIEIDLFKYQVTKADKIIELTVREYELLVFLVKNKGKVFTREQLLEKVWEFEYYGDVRTVDVTVRRLREKIEDDPAKALLVLTKRGVGYYAQ